LADLCKKTTSIAIGEFRLTKHFFIVKKFFFATSIKLSIDIFFKVTYIIFGLYICTPRC
jgi:hypothetical protein